MIQIIRSISYKKLIKYQKESIKKITSKGIWEKDKLGNLKKLETTKNYFKNSLRSTEETHKKITSKSSLNDDWKRIEKQKI